MPSVVSRSRCAGVSAAALAGTDAAAGRRRAPADIADHPIGVAPQMDGERRARELPASVLHAGRASEAANTLRAFHSRTLCECRAHAPAAPPRLSEMCAPRQTPLRRIWSRHHPK